MQIELCTSSAAARIVYPEAAKLYARIYGYPPDLQQWSRFYFANPYGDPLVALGYHDGHLIGHQALVPQQLVDDEGQISSYYLAISLLVDPAYRGLQHFLQLVGATTTAARERGAQFLLGFPNANSFALFQRCFGWRPLHETRLYNWRPSRHYAQPAAITALTTWRISKATGHPFDPVYRTWRSQACAYFTEQVNGRLSVVYKLPADRTLTVLDAATDQPAHGPADLAALLAHSGATQVRLTGIHAAAIGLDPAQLELHSDYVLRFSYAPLLTEPPPLRFSLLLSDVF